MASNDCLIIDKIPGNRPGINAECRSYVLSSVVLSRCRRDNICQLIREALTLCDNDTTGFYLTCLLRMGDPRDVALMSAAFKRCSSNRKLMEKMSLEMIVLASGGPSALRVKAQFGVIILRRLLRESDISSELFVAAATALANSKYVTTEDLLWLASQPSTKHYRKLCETILQTYIRISFRLEDD